MTPDFLNMKKATIDAIDFSMIIMKMVEHEGWKRADAEEACRLYKNFLFLRVKYPGEKLPPSEDIDEVWHNHILDTKKYREDCNTLFGEYLDHYPYFGIDSTTTMADLNKAFEVTQKLHFEEFGDFIYEVRRSSFFKRIKNLVMPAQVGS